MQLHRNAKWLYWCPSQAAAHGALVGKCVRGSQRSRGTAWVCRAHAPLQLLRPRLRLLPRRVQAGHRPCEPVVHVARADEVHIVPEVQRNRRLPPHGRHTVVPAPHATPQQSLSESDSLDCSVRRRSEKRPRESIEPREEGSVGAPQRWEVEGLPRPHGDMHRGRLYLREGRVQRLRLGRLPRVQLDPRHLHWWSSTVAETAGRVGQAGGRRGG